MAFLIGKIQLDTGYEVVLSSSWRHMPEGVAEVEKQIVTLSNRDFASPKPEAMKSSAWLGAHPEVSRYAIVDDDSDFHSRPAVVQDVAADPGSRTRSQSRSPTT